ELSVPQDVAMTRVVERSDDEACPSVPYLFADRLAIEAYSTTCDPSSRNPMNGHYGRYRSFDDVADPIDAVTVTPASDRRHSSRRSTPSAPTPAVTRSSR